MTFLFGSEANAGLYKCEVEGKTGYTDKPCADPAQRESGRLDDDPRFRSGANSETFGSGASGSAAPDTSPIDFGDSVANAACNPRIHVVTAWGSTIIGKAACKYIEDRDRYNQRGREHNRRERERLRNMAQPPPQFYKLKAE